MDYAGLVNQNYQNQLGQYNAKTAQGNSTQSALFGLGGSFLANGGASWLAGLSDVRLKENIVRIGSTPAGLGVYEYNFIGSDKTETGVIAQEVEKVLPHAVVTGDDGYKRVFYAEVR